MNLCLEKRKGIFLIFVRSGQAILQLRKIRSILPEQEILCWRTSTAKQPYQKTYITIERDEQRRELVPFICAWGKKQRFTRTYIYIRAHVYGYGETEKGRLLARFELIAMVSWTLIAVD